MATGGGRGGGHGRGDQAKGKLADLVVRAQAGDRGAFEELYRRTAQAQYFTIVGRVGEGPAADILQEVYLVAWKNRAKIRPQAVIGYLSATARNLCLQHFQQRARMADDPVTDEGAGAAADDRQQPVAQGGRDEAADPACAYDAAERRRRLAAALRDDLTDRERDAVLMRYYLDMKVGEIAEALEVSRNTVRNLINSALATLRRKVGVLPLGAALAPALAEAVEAAPAPGAALHGRGASRSLQWGTRAMAAVTVVAAVGVLGAAATWQPPEPEVVADEPVPLTQAAPADTIGPELVSTEVADGQLVLTARDEAGVREVSCTGADGAAYEPARVERDDAHPAESTWWFAVPSGTYEVRLTDGEGNESVGTVEADVLPIYPAPAAS